MNFLSQYDDIISRDALYIILKSLIHSLYIAYIWVFTFQIKHIHFLNRFLKMNSCSRIWTMLSILLFIIMKSQKFVKGDPLVPCLFFMGDSLFDNGNNNFLLTMAKSNYPPYGIDYPDGPTGRFSNGRNIADFLGLYVFHSVICEF